MSFRVVCNKINVSKMNRFFNHFHPKMPFFLVSKLKKLSYDPEKFINWYIKFPDISKTYDGVKGKKLLIYCVSAYYVWVFYLLSCAVVASFNIVVGVIGVIISPFIVGSYIYAMAYLTDKLKKSLIKNIK